MASSLSTAVRVAASATSGGRRSVSRFSRRRNSGSPAASAASPTLPGVHECLVVTRGGVATGPDDDPVELAVGDAVYFDASTRHRYEGTGEDNRALLVMIYPDH